MSNTDNDIFMHLSKQSYYTLLSGRWFTTKKLVSEAHWTHVPSADLPATFAQISSDSVKAHVLVSVPNIIYTIPPSSPFYYVTFNVYLGYTPGYLGSFIFNNALIFGAGHYYPRVKKRRPRVKIFITPQRKRRTAPRGYPRH